MMVIKDMSLAGYVRLQISHVYKVMAIIQEIRDNPALMKAVDHKGKVLPLKAFEQFVA
jgi:hypothetical protein